MKIIVSSFQCESNSRAKTHPQYGDFEYFTGDDIFRKLAVKEVFDSAGIEVIPSIYAAALPSGTVEKEVYFYYAEQIEEVVKRHADADGIYIYFHGSMEVEELGSGELCLLKELRKIVDRNCLIALTFDAHANVPTEIAQYADIICGYKTVPHTDQKESQVRAAKALTYCLKNKVKPYLSVKRIPMLLKNDTLLTAQQPLKGLIDETIAMENTRGVLAANLFLGHCWIDATNTSATSVVCAEDPILAETSARHLANGFWATRRDYRFFIEAYPPEKCVKEALSGTENRIFVTDSGDNTTAGAEGESDEFLRLFLKEKTDKNICVAGITDAPTVERCRTMREGEEIYLRKFGKTAKVVTHGKILGWTKEIIGDSVTLRIGNTDAIFTERRSAFIEKGNFEKAGVELERYHVVVVKLGYLFTELKPYADREIFALSDGASCIELSKLDLKRIIRPMYPLDDFEWEA